MSLVVWLPLTKDLRQQGLSNVTVTNNGATFNSAGKLGGCYAPNGLTLTNLGNLKVYPMTITFWCKTTNTGTPSWEQIVLIDNTSNSQIHGVYVADASRLKYEYNPSVNAYSVNPKEWHHYTFIINNGDSKVYVDGILNSSSSETVTADIIGRLRIGTTSTIQLNDFRIYDHCLSPMEVKELAKGLVLHYSLSDNSIQAMNNCYSYPRFETSNSNGGWSHWGSSGHVGTYGQTTDINYIFRSGQTYAHWVADGSSATKDYLLYQEPAFDGGLRSLVAICKEENSKPITNNICYATWNARNGGVVNNSWTSIKSLGDGFYLCKCEGISQDGSNDLVGIYIKPGYKVYFSEVYLENNRSISSDIFFPTNIVYDCSGLSNNSILSSSATVSTDTAKYTYSTYFGEYNTPKTDLIDNSLLSALTNCTITWWEKNDTTRTLLLTGQTTSHYIAASDNNTYYHGTVNGTKTLYRDGIAGTYKCEAGVWHHYALVGVDISTWTALHLNSYGSYWYLKGLVSDLRIYATALSADDVKSLYQNSAYIDSSGNVYGAVHMEV